jgi:hypothetical protein
LDSGHPMIDRKIVRRTHEDAAEVDGRLPGGEAAVHERDDGGGLRDEVAAVALPRHVQLAALVLGEPLQPIHQEDVRVLGGPPVAGGLVVGGVSREGEPDARRRLQEDHVCHCILTYQFSCQATEAAYVIKVTSCGFHVRLFQACLFSLSVSPSGLTRNGPSSIIAPYPSDEHPGPAPEKTAGEETTPRVEIDDRVCVCVQYSSQLPPLSHRMSGLEAASAGDSTK